MSPAGYPAPSPRKPGMPTWLLVIIIIVPILIALVGMGSVLAIYGVRKYIVNAKTAEARNTLRQIGLLAVTAFERDGRVCPSASAPVPATVPSATKYMSTDTDWEVDKARNAGFACLGFSMSMPQYFQYSYRATPTSIVITARGDLNGDGSTSEFSLSGEVRGGILAVAPTYTEKDPFE